MESALEITVIFTRKSATLKALGVARRLAEGLGSRIRLVVPHIVPFPVPLNEPLVDRSFLEREFTNLISAEPTDIFVDIRICRDRWQMLSESLIPNSVLVLSDESRLATALRAAGHSVVLLK